MTVTVGTRKWPSWGRFAPAYMRLEVTENMVSLTLVFGEGKKTTVLTNCEVTWKITLYL